MMNQNRFNLHCCNAKIAVFIAWTAAVIVCSMTLSTHSVAAAGDSSGLQLKPCTIELVDGTKVDGQLAVQFDMDKHLIVYSPRLATVRSFLKDHVHALTVDGKREQLNPKRALTDEDRKLLGQVAWPDEPPDEGFKPAYTTEKWDKPRRLLVWAKPGKSGRYSVTGNWLENGRPLKEIPRTENLEHAGGNLGGQDRIILRKVSGDFGPDTDILVPCFAGKRYQIRGSAHWKPGEFMTRHITVEGNALFQHNLDGGFGNFWIALRGSFNGGGNAIFRGSKHTFLSNGLPREGTEPVTDPQTLEAKGLARKWVLRKDDPNASMEIIGSAGSGDETHVMRGRLVVAENSNVVIGPRCTPLVHEGAVVELHSGSYFGKLRNQPAPDTEILGTLLAGTPERPLRRDCYMGIGCADWKGRIRELPSPVEGLRSWESIPGNRVENDPPMHIGLTVTETGKVRVHSTDPTRARLVLRWHGDASVGMGGGAARLNLQTERQKKMWEQISGRICAAFAGDVQFDGVVFDHFHAGGILLADMAMPDKWEHVYYGEHNAAKPAELYAPIPNFLQVGGGGRGGQWKYPENAPVAEITPRRNAYVAGRDTVRVTLSSDAGPGTQIRYTTDGSFPDARANLYTGPITVKQTTVIKARCFNGDRRLGPPRRREYIFHSPEQISIEPRETTATEPGLVGKLYEKADRYTNWNVFDKVQPTKRDIVEQLDLELSGGEPAAIAFDGCLTVKRPGVYRFVVVTDHQPRGKNKFFTMTLGGEQIFRDALFASTDGNTRQAGLAVLAPGFYALHARGLIEGRKLAVLWEGSGIESQPIPTEALSRQQWWNAVITPGGGLHEGGETVAVRMSVDTRADVSGATVRYTMDGTEPTARSAVYEAPLKIEKDTTVRARCFRDGEPLTGKSATAKFMFLGGLEDAKPGLVYRLYEGGWSKLPDFETLEPVASGVTKQFDLSVSERGGNFGLVFNGYLIVATPGKYTFYTTSDDGSSLYVDDQKVVDNDGAHGSQQRSGTVTLSKGPHLIRVEYFQGIGGKGLKVHWSGPGIDKQSIPVDVLKH